MALRHLLDQNDPFALRNDHRAESNARTAIAFAFDASYIEPFRIMLYSMVRSGSLLDCPIYIYSDDPAVLGDQVVCSVADRLCLVEGKDLGELVEIAERNIQRADRADWNKGTCLKWAVFDDAPVDQILFLDVDMLCLRPINNLLQIHPEAALVSCPQFQRTIMPPVEAPGAGGQIATVLLDLITGRTDLPARINSGVMLIRKPLLNRRFRGELIDFAGARTAINEQSHLTSFFRSPENQGRYPLAMASVAYNFQENYLKEADPIDALKIARRIRILHYAGAPKPWRAKKAQMTRPTMQIWAQYRHAAEVSRVFAGTD